MELLSKDYNYLDFIIGKIKWQEKVFDCTGGKVIEVINIRKIIFQDICFTCIKEKDWIKCNYSEAYSFLQKRRITGMLYKF